MAIPKSVYGDYRRNCDVSLEKDTSGKWIVAGVVALVAIAMLPQFDWFQRLTAITGWIPFFRTVFGW